MAGVKLPTGMQKAGKMPALFIYAVVSKLPELAAF
jgi:hypothetical protein